MTEIPVPSEIVGRSLWGDDPGEMRRAYGALFASQGIAIDCHDEQQLVVFPEMDKSVPVPEITESCWDILHVSPRAMMCASSRMVVRRRDSDAPAVVACTLLPYDPAFEMGVTLAQSARTVKLHHPHCAQFCVLGGGSCSTNSQ